MLRKSLLIQLTCFFFINCNNASADYFSKVDPLSAKNYNFSSVSIPDSAGLASKDMSGNAFSYQNRYSDTVGGTVELTINGTLLGDGKTYATSNPGVGVQYTLHMSSTAGLTPTADITQPPFVYTITSHGTSEGVTATHTVNVWFRLVRISEHVPPGEIVTVPDAALTFKNVGSDGDPITTGTVLSGISKQPKIVTCIIDAPTEIKLAALYGANIVAGAQNISAIPEINLNKCPGAINSISYKFHAVYGTHDASNAVLNVETGSGYANGVYVQIQNSDTSAHSIETVTPFNYTGSGTYAIPSFNVAYFVDDINRVTAGKVKSAIELQISYN